MTELDLDVLTRIAFGEEEPGDQERLRAILDAHPDAQRELDEMRLLCGDLGVLANVPQPQITFGRVRHAIEAASVRPRRSFPTWSVVVGLAGAAAAFALFSVVNKSAPVVAPTASTVVAVNDKPAFSASQSATTEEPAEDLDSLVQDMMATPARSVDEPVASAAKPRPAKRSARPAFARRQPVAESFAAPPDLAAKRSENFSAMLSSDQDTHSIVIVTNRPDPETGAARAFESTDSSSIEFRG